MFEWAKYLRVARTLASASGDEAALRAAISRAYYAALGTAHWRLLRHGWRRPSGPIHHHVWRTFRNADNLACRRIGDLGFRLRDQRVAADYRIPYPGDIANEAALALSQTDQLLDRLAALDSDDVCF